MLLSLFIVPETTLKNQRSKNNAHFYTDKISF